MDKNTDVLILGAGIAGLEAFRTLRKKFKKHNINKEITIIDKNNYFTFIPLLHEVAAGAVDPSHTTLPVRELTYKTKHKFQQAEVESISPETKKVETSSGTFEYERCIVALGSVTNFFGVEGAKEHTHHVRTLREALQLKNSIIKQLESQTDKINMNIIGGGYTGVEIAAEFAQMKEDDFKKLYPETDIEINIIEASDSIMRRMKEKVQNKVRARLEKLNVNIKTQVSANEVTAEKVILSNEQELKNDVTVWSTGFKTKAKKFLKNEYLKKDRIVVNNNLQTTKDNSIYAIGDIALITPPDGGDPYPQLGEASHKEGEYLARQITAEINDKEIEPFSFKSKGRLMPVGEWYGVAVIPWLNNLTFTGRFAWWLRRTAYVLFLPGLIRKIRIVFDWTLRTFGFRNLTEIAVKDYKEK